MSNVATNGISFDPNTLYSPFRTTQSPVPGTVRAEEPLTQSDFEESSEIREEYVRFFSDRNIQVGLAVAGSLRTNYLTPGLSSLLSNPPFDIFESNLDGSLTTNALVAQQLYANNKSLNQKGTDYNLVITSGLPASTAGISNYNPDLSTQYNYYTPNQYIPKNSVDVSV